MRGKWIAALAIVAALTLFVGVFQSVFAAEKTMVIKVPGCAWSDTATTVRITVSRVDGVKSVEPNPISQTATIVFDDTKTNFEKIKDELKRAGQTVVGQPTYK